MEDPPQELIPVIEEDSDDIPILEENRDPIPIPPPWIRNTENVEIALSVRPDVTTLSYNPQQYKKGSHRCTVCICQRSVGEMELDLQLLEVKEKAGD